MRLMFTITDEANPGYLVPRAFSAFKMAGRAKKHPDKAAKKTPRIVEYFVM